MSWKTHIEELRARERLAEQMGGEERVSRQRSQGKLTVRERIAFLAEKIDASAFSKHVATPEEEIAAIKAANKIN